MRFDSKLQAGLPSVLLRFLLHISEKKICFALRETERTQFQDHIHHDDVRAVYSTLVFFSNNQTKKYV